MLRHGRGHESLRVNVPQTDEDDWPILSRKSTNYRKERPALKSPDKRPEKYLPRMHEKFALVSKFEKVFRQREKTKKS